MAENNEGNAVSLATITEKDGEAQKRGVQRLATFEEALGLAGVGTFHRILLLISGMCLASAILETVVVGYLLPSAVCELQLTSADKGLLGAISYVGIVLSSHTWGLIADTKGRRTALLTALLLDFVASLLSSLSPNFATLLLLRFFCGVFTCAPAALCFAYLGEFHSEKTRGKAIIWIGAFPAIGLIILPAVAWLILPMTWSIDLGFIHFTSWRLLLVFSALTTLVTAVLLWFLLPESPKFLLGTDPEKALEVLRTMYTKNTRQPACNFPITALLVPPPNGLPAVSTIEVQINQDSVPSPATIPSPPTRSPSMRTFKTIWRQTAPLFKPPHLAHTLLVCLLQFGNLASANALQIWLPDIFNYVARFSEAWPESSATVCQSIAKVAEGESLANAGGPCTAEVKQQAFVNNIIIGFASLVVPILCGMFVNKIGKKNLLLGSLTLTGICGNLLNVAVTDEQVLALSSVIVAVNAMCIYHISSIVVDLFPTHFRAMAVSLSLMAGRSGSIAGNLLFGALLKTECTAAFYVLGGALLVCAAMTCTLPRRGKYAS